MAIKKIALENFTVFKNTELSFCSGVNVLIGENGTGKTHLLKLLYATHLTHSDSKYSISNVFGEDFNLPILLSNIVIDESGKISEKWRTANVHLNTFDSVAAQGQISDCIKSFNINVKITSSRPETPIFIPAKDMLTHSRLEKDYAERNLPFDRTLIDILNKAGVSTVKNLDSNMMSIADDIAKVIGGKIVYRNDRYYVKKVDDSLIGFDMEAEGFKKLGLLYRLIETGYFKEGSILLWDEPEANLNPKLIPVVVDILLRLSKSGIQIFLATHEYNLMKYFSVKKSADDQVAFVSLHKTENGVISETEDDYNLLEHNSIVEANIKLLEVDIEGVL